jgi:hypothetical protein
MISQEFIDISGSIMSGQFGKCHPVISEMLLDILKGDDTYLTGVEFKSYILAQQEIDTIFKDKKEFCRRVMMTLGNLGSF